MSDHERFAQVAHQKCATMSESLIRSFFAKIERFAQKTDERIPNPASHWARVIAKF